MGHPRVRTDWEEIRALIASGVTYAEVSERYGIKVDALRQRAKRGNWPTVDRVNIKANELAKERQALSVTSVMSCPQKSDITEVLADSWLERQENHRLLAFKLANGALNRVKAPKIRGWRDIDTADKMARRAAGLDESQSQTINVGLTLVNQRIASVTTPKTINIQDT